MSREYRLSGQSDKRTTTCCGGRPGPFDMFVAVRRAGIFLTGGGAKAALLALLLKQLGITITRRA